MNPEGLELMFRTIAKLEERVSALEAAQPAPLEFPVIEPERLASVQAAERLGMERFDYAERN